LRLDEFYPLFGTELSDPKHVETYKQYLASQASKKAALSSTAVSEISITSTESTTVNDSQGSMTHQKNLEDPQDQQWKALKNLELVHSRNQFSINGKELFIDMMKESTKLDPLVVHAIQKLKASARFKLAALTNNFQLPSSQPSKDSNGATSDGTSRNDDDELGIGTPPIEFLKSLFDFYIESAVVGLRKPDPRFFLYACEQVLGGVKPEECVFLDDIGV
jgi:FMN phosphatase YigB (HAD superfamily)